MVSLVSDPISFCWSDDPVSRDGANKAFVMKKQGILHQVTGIEKRVRINAVIAPFLIFDVKS